MSRKTDPLTIAASMFVGSGAMTIMAAIEGPLTWQHLATLTAVAAVYLGYHAFRPQQDDSRPAAAVAPHAHPE